MGIEGMGSIPRKRGNTERKRQDIRRISRLDTVAYAYNPSTLGSWSGQIIWGQEFKTSLATWQNPISTKNTKIRPATVAHAYNPSTLGGRGRWITRSRDQDHPGQHGETPSLLKIQKISWAWWHVPVISATREAEAGELPEPRRRRLWWAEITPRHCTPAWVTRAKLHLKKKKKKRILPAFLWEPCSV